MKTVKKHMKERNKKWKPMKISKNAQKERKGKTNDNQRKLK